MIKKTSDSRWIYLTYAVLVLIYLGFVFLKPINQSILEQYSLSAVQFQFLRLAVILPLMLIWFTAFYGFTKLREYASLIADHSEGAALLKISSGIGVLAYGLPIRSISTIMLREAGHLWPNFATTGFMIRKYIGLLITLTAFILILKGTVRLEQFKNKIHFRYKEWILFLLFLSASLYFVYLGTMNPSLQFIGDAGEVTGGGTNFNIPLWVLLLTLVIPYLITWFIGLASACMLYVHKNKVKGKIYRNFWVNLSAGLATVIFASVLMQYMHMLASYLNTLPLRALMTVIFLFLIVLASGYILIARSAIQLKRIEEA